MDQRQSSDRQFGASAARARARVLAPGGRLSVIDVIAPEMPLLDTVLQAVEFLRAASHVRSFATDSAWMQSA